MTRLRLAVWLPPLMFGLGLVMFASVVRAEGKDEDPDRITAQWRAALPPTDYLRALEVTGQGAELRAGFRIEATSWAPIGPTGDPIPTPAMQPPYNENNGRIRSIQIRSENGTQAIYVGASSGGLWRAYANAGPVWTSLGDALANPSVGAFAVHPTNANDILLGTGDYNRYGGAGLFRTQDAGLSWTPVALPVAPDAFFQIFYLPGNSNVVLLATSEGLLRSTSGPGGPWTVRLTGLVTDLVIHPTVPGTQYCCRATTFGGGGGVYKSTDAGQNWTLISAASVPPTSVAHSRIALCRNFPTHLAFTWESNGVIAGIVTSSDDGAHWTTVGGSPPIAAGQAFHALAIAIKPNDPNEIWIGANQIWRTTTGGAPWTDLTPLATHQDQTQLLFSSLTGDNVLWIANDGGLHRYVEGAGSSVSWNGDATTGLRVSTVDYMDAMRDLRVAGRQDDGNLSSDDDGTSWSLHSCCDGFDVAITDDLNPRFWYSRNGAVTRQPFFGSGQDVSYASGGLSQLFYDRLSDRVYSIYDTGANTRVLGRPENGSGTWTDEASGVQAGLGGLAGSVLNGQTMLAWGGTTLAVLQENGSVWTTLRTAQLENAISIAYLSTEQPLEAWAGLAGSSGTPKLLHTTNGWASWTDLSGTLSSVGSVQSIAVAPFNSNEIYAGTDVGVFQSLDGGVTWQPFQTGLPIVACRALRWLVDPTHTGNDKLVVATYGRGLYERAMPRLPLVYVDPRNTGSLEDGTYEHAYKTFAGGRAATPTGGVLGLHGGMYSSPSQLTQPMFLKAYETPVRLLVP